MRVLCVFSWVAVDQPSDMCQVGMRYVVCRAQGRFLENVTLVYIQQIFNLFFCFFSPWNSIDVLIWKDKIKMYFKTFLNWTPDPEIHFWESRLFSDFKIKAQTLLFQQSRRFLSQLGWVCTSFHRFLCEKSLCRCLPQNFLHGASFHICLLFWMSVCSKIFVEFCTTWRTPYSSYA